MANITRILFIGNSFTARNDLPGLLGQLVHAGGKGELECELISSGGASLRMHLNKGEAQERLQTSGWDYVVLQEQSTLPVKNPKRTGENIREFDAIIKAAQAQTVLYMTWARQNAPETQAALSETYTEAGGEIGATVVPVGLAWRDCLAPIPLSSCTTRTKATPTSPDPIWRLAHFTRRSLSAGPSPFPTSTLV